MKPKANKELKEEGSRARTVLSTVAAFIALAGLADATYLTVVAMTGEAAACAGVTGCFEVLGSPFARLLAFPWPLSG